MKYMISEYVVKSGSIKSRIRMIFFKVYKYESGALSGVKTDISDAKNPLINWM